jgi:hypothetical protein|tara:strand:- start:1554 stop:1739 length:186 start_codon:yes stop_codon:yes gene_type:complete
MSADLNKVVLEERKVEALEKIATSLDSLTLWIEEIDKEEWGDRVQFYLGEWHRSIAEKTNE